MILARFFKCSTPWAKGITSRTLTSIFRSKNVGTIEQLPFIKDFHLEKSLVTLNIALRQPTKRIEDVPLHNVIIENPRSTLLNEINEIIRSDNALEAPAFESKITEIKAARLIVIRRRKMKKHKLRKLRKKMKFEWGKVRQRREMRKEKAFQADLIAQIKVAEQFSAEEYVNEKLRKANEIPIPRYWKGRRLPQFIIKQLLGMK